MSDFEPSVATVSPAVATERTPPPGWVWIVVAGILAHWLVPLTDYVLWDGWWYASDLVRTEGPSTMARLFHEVGRPLDMMFYAPMRWLGGNPVVWSKLWSSAAWIGSAVAMADVLHRAGRAPKAVAVAAAVLAVTLPVFDLLGELALWMNVGAILLFWIGWVIVSRLPAMSGWPSAGARLAALSLFFVSFDLNSNLVMFYAVAVTLACLRSSESSWKAWGVRMAWLAIRHADFLAMPVIFWVWKTVFTPTNGYYATGYNQPSLNPIGLAVGYLVMASNFLVTGVLELLSNTPWIVVSLAVGAGFAYVLRVSHWRAPTPVPMRLGLSLVAWGFFLLLAAGFPYIAVGQPLASEGWWSRNCVLCGLPLGLIACGMATLINAIWLQRHSTAWLVTVAIIAALGIGATNRNYLVYQAFGAKQKAAHRILHDVIEQTGSCVVQVRDYMPVPHTIPYYPPIIWSFIASGTAASPRAFAFDSSGIAPDRYEAGVDGDAIRIPPRLQLSSRALKDSMEETTLPYALESVPLRGPQVLVTLDPARKDLPAPQLGLSYLLLSWFSPEERDKLVASLIQPTTYAIGPVE